MSKPDLDLVDYMGEIYRRLKLLDSVAEALESPADDETVLEDIRTTLSRYLEARAYVKSLKEEK